VTGFPEPLKTPVLVPPTGAAVPNAGASPGSLLRVADVSKSFAVRGSTTQMTVLDRINFDLREGEFISLLGASGCGKTTLLRIIAGLIHPDAGSVTLKGSRIEAPRKDLCMVFQNFGLLPWRSVLDNVAFPLELDGVGRKEREETAAHYLEIVGLQRFHDHYPHELSGGMQQRVGIARALMRKPVVLLMDEPFGALDAQTRESLQDDFLRIWTNLKTTVVFVTHSIDEALVLSDRVIVFSSRPGRVKYILPSAVASERMVRDVRAMPEFGFQAHELREHLRHERTT
jgi:NitT/TauT family transport system ATP-binding protein